MSWEALRECYSQAMKTPPPHTPGRKLLTAISWLLFLGGLFGSFVCFVKVSHHLPVREYASLVLVSGMWLGGSAGVVFLRSRI